MFAGSGNWEPVGGEIYKTTDSGETWYAVSPQFTNAISFAFDPSSPSIGYAGTRVRGVYKTTDGGDTWLAANAGLPASAYYASLVMHPQRSEEIYAATEAGLYVSYDAAGSWHALWEGVAAKSVLLDPRDPARVYLGTTDGLFVSDDGGVRWYSMEPCGSDTSTNRLAVDPSVLGVLWAATNDGLWRCSMGDRDP
jgi:photosystem II stability/assembly factor-like uncharacterized protein